MAMGRESDRQSDLMVTWAEMPRSPGHLFYDRLQAVLIAGGFDGFVETACQPYYAPKMGAQSVPPGRYFRMHMLCANVSPQPQACLGRRFATSPRPDLVGRLVNDDDPDLALASGHRSRHLAVEAVQHHIGHGIPEA